jgi:hypothetical protein
MQEKRKEDSVENYTPKLSWYEKMKNAFEHGKAKSFSKFHANLKKENLKKERIVHIEYETEEQQYIPNESQERNFKAENTSKNSSAQIIIEPYEDEENDMEEEMENDYREPTHLKFEIQQSPNIQKSSEEKIIPESTESPFNTLSSNELFLQSLKKPLDKLSFEKNMWVRCKIQELIYKTIYEKP